MIKRIFKISLLIIVLVSVFLFSRNVKADTEKDAKKGDLRCPSTKKGKSTCDEIKNRDGEVIETIVTTTDGNMTIKKHVKKKEIGTYSIWFEVDGNAQKTTNKPGYIVILFDESGSMVNKNIARQVITEFSEKAIKMGHQVALVEFANKSIETKFDVITSKGKIDKFHDPGNNSKICSGLNGTYKLLNTNEIKEDKDAYKYIILFGDGEYMYAKDICSNGNSEIPNKLNQLKDNISNLRYIGIRYPSSHDKNGDKNRCLTAYSSTVCKNLIPRIWDSNGKVLGKKTGCYKSGGAATLSCNEKYMEEIVTSNGNENGSWKSYESGEYKKAFDEALSKISLETGTVKYSGDLVDVIGSNFSLSSGGKKITKTFKNLPENTKEYEIKIDQNAETGWHNTNKNVTFKYNDKEITSTLNPEVYWEKEKGWQACSDYSSSSVNSSYIGDYIEETCIQKDKNGKRGFYAELKTNGQSIGTKVINLAYGTGFPITIDVESMVECTYKFNIDAFNKAYNAKYKEWQSSNGKEKASKEKELENMKADVEKYISKSGDNLKDLNEYKDRFENLNAVLQIDYSSSSGSKIVDFQNSGSSKNDITCSVNNQGNITIDEKKQKIYTERTCTLISKKTLNLPLSCLSMVSGNAEDCNKESNTQVSGGNYFYPDNEEKSGFISVTLKNATYSGADVILKGNKKSDSKNYDCQFFVGDPETIVYRQIELSDPFVQTYTNETRKIGSNWKNNNYNFTNVIKSDLWETENGYEYKYQLSKVNIENIKSDTSSSVQNYLGSDCKFNSDNKYVCSFVRDDSFFTIKKIK